MSKSPAQGGATFTVPYTLPEGKSAEDLKVYCIKDGAVSETISCTYSDGKVTFSTGHLSTDSVGFIDSSDNGNGSEFPIWIVSVIAVIAVAAIGAVFFLERGVPEPYPRGRNGPPSKRLPFFSSQPHAGHYTL